MISKLYLNSWNRNFRHFRNFRILRSMNSLKMEWTDSLNVTFHANFHRQILIVHHHARLWREIKFYAFLTLTLDGGQWWPSCLHNYTPERRVLELIWQMHGGSVFPQALQEDTEIAPKTGQRFLPCTSLLISYSHHPIIRLYIVWSTDKKQNKKNNFRGFSPQANYTGRATAACRWG
jgi:hypothetical protein